MLGKSINSDEVLRGAFESSGDFPSISFDVIVAHLADRSCAGSKPKWADSATGKFLELVSFLNVENTHTLNLVEWIPRGKKKQNKSGNGKFGGR